MESRTQDEADQKDPRDILFDFWQDIPIIKTVSDESFESISSHEIRDAMVQVLRKGMIDEKRGKKRYALNLAELLPLIEEKITRESGTPTHLKRTALYHHRDIVLENDLIQEVATILEGKRHVTYYGRTARAFIAEHDGSPKKDNQRKILQQLITELNSDIDEDSIAKKLDDLEDQINTAFQQNKQWVENHVELFNRLDLDAIEIFKLLQPFFFPQTQTVTQLRDLLDIPSK